MQKNLRWKLILILALMAICVYYFVSPREKGAGLLSRLNLGLDLKGGIHLALQVVTDDALNQELFQDAERISQDLKSKNLPFADSKKGNGFSVEISGVDSARGNEVRTYLESTYDRKYSLRSTTLEGRRISAWISWGATCAMRGNRRCVKHWRPSGGVWTLWV